MTVKVLSIAGSDPSGGAGIQADLKTFSRLRVYGMAVITALTAQNTAGVSGVFEVAPAFVGEQLDAVISDLRPDAVKTGMLSNNGIVEAVASRIRQYGLTNVVVDPVMVSKAGSPLLREDAVEAVRRVLSPLSTLITPNLAEAAVLTGARVQTLEDMEEAARRLHAMGAPNVLVKGGHLEGDAVDVFYDGTSFQRFSAARIRTRDSHGTGCVLSAAIAAHLGSGRSLPDAVRFAKEFVTDAIRNGLRIGSGAGPCDPVGL